jgi:hypothetical protein
MKQDLVVLLFTRIASKQEDLLLRVSLGMGAVLTLLHSREVTLLLVI